MLSRRRLVIRVAGGGSFSRSSRPCSTIRSKACLYASLLFMGKRSGIKSSVSIGAPEAVGHLDVSASPTRKTRAFD